MCRQQESMKFGHRSNKIQNVPAHFANLWIISKLNSIFAKLRKKPAWGFKWKITLNVTVDVIFCRSSSSSSDVYFLSTLWIPGWSLEIVCEQKRSAVWRHSPRNTSSAKLFELFDDTNASPGNYPLKPLSVKVSAIFSLSAWEQVSAKYIAV